MYHKILSNSMNLGPVWRASG